MNMHAVSEHAEHAFLMLIQEKAGERARCGVALQCMRPHLLHTVDVLTDIVL